ncbi:uncharacterized protein N7498_000020, partial [Penicillium cinerascens]
NTISALIHDSPDRAVTAIELLTGSDNFDIVSGDLKRPDCLFKYVKSITANIYPLVEPHLVRARSRRSSATVNSRAAKPKPTIRSSGTYPRILLRETTSERYSSAREFVDRVQLLVYRLNTIVPRSISDRTYIAILLTQIGPEYILVNNKDPVNPITIGNRLSNAKWKVGRARRLLRDRGSISSLQPYYEILDTASDLVEAEGISTRAKAIARPLFDSSVSIEYFCVTLKTNRRDYVPRGGGSTNPTVLYKQEISQATRSDRISKLGRLEGGPPVDRHSVPTANIGVATSNAAVLGVYIGNSRARQPRLYSTRIFELIYSDLIEIPIAKNSSSLKPRCADSSAPRSKDFSLITGENIYQLEYISNPRELRQNRLAERTNRTIRERINTLLSDTNLSPFYGLSKATYASIDLTEEDSYKLYKIYSGKTVFSRDIEFDKRTPIALFIEREIGNDLLDNAPLSLVFLLIPSSISGLLTLSISPLALSNKQEQTLSKRTDLTSDLRYSIYSRRRRPSQRLLESLVGALNTALVRYVDPATFYKAVLGLN